MEKIIYVTVVCLFIGTFLYLVLDGLNSKVDMVLDKAKGIVLLIAGIFWNSFVWISNQVRKLIHR